MIPSSLEPEHPVDMDDVYDDDELEREYQAHMKNKRLRENAGRDSKANSARKNPRSQASISVLGKDSAYGGPSNPFGQIENAVSQAKTKLHEL